MKEHQLNEPIAIPYEGADIELSKHIGKCIVAPEFVDPYLEAMDKVLTPEDGCPYCNEGLKSDVFYNLQRALLPIAMKYKVSIGTIFSFPTHTNIEKQCVVCDGSVILGEPEVLVRRAINMANELVDAVTITTAVRAFDARQ